MSSGVPISKKKILQSFLHPRIRGRTSPHSTKIIHKPRLLHFGTNPSRPSTLERIRCVSVDYHRFQQFFYTLPREISTEPSRHIRPTFLIRPRLSVSILSLPLSSPLFSNPFHSCSYILLPQPLPFFSMEFLLYNLPISFLSMLSLPFIHRYTPEYCTLIFHTLETIHRSYRNIARSEDKNFFTAIFPFL